MKPRRLFDTARVTGPRSRCTDLVPLARALCLACGSETRTATIGEPALFRHGGYGATRLTTFLLCANEACRAVRFLRVEEVRPNAPVPKLSIA